MLGKTMLALSVKRGQRVRITTPSGEVIWVTLVKSGKGGSTIGFDAPRSVEILHEAVIANDNAAEVVTEEQGPRRAAEAVNS
ncbi:MAG: hypothetical protein C0467_28685 [Planctomycetaceae bacterium]|nr:hypothetical protein [Planctomycetaceae bacterium]